MSLLAGVATMFTACSVEDNPANSIDPSLAPEEVLVDLDCTALVATDGWGGGWCATQYAPAVTTADGRTSQLQENYVHGMEGDAKVLLQQTIDGLKNGTYKVELYANAFFTPGRGFDSDMQDGATDVAYVFANDVKCPIVGQIADHTAKNGEYAFEVKVTDGKLTLGLGKEKAGTNWHTIQIKSLALVDGQTVGQAYEALLPQAQALLKEKMSANVKAALEAAVAAEKSSMHLNALKKAIAAVLDDATYKSYQIIKSGVIPTNNLDYWTCDNGNTFHINTWSTEGNSDGTGMTTPFVECWCAAGDGALKNGTIKCVLPSLLPGDKLTVSALIRVNSEAGNAISGATFYCGDTKIDLATAGTAFEFNAIKGVYGTFTAEGTVNADGNLEFGVKIEDATFNWIAIKDVTIK